MTAKLHVKLQNGRSFEIHRDFTTESLLSLDLNWLTPDDIKEILIKPYGGAPTFDPA